MSAVSILFRSAACLALCVPLLLLPHARAADAAATRSVKVGNGLFQPASAELPARSWADLRAWIAKTGPALALHWRADGAAESVLALPEELAQVNGLYRHAGRLVVTGWMNGALATAVIIVDVAEGRLVDVFWGYGVSVAPDASAIAFVRFHPSHFVAGPEDQYRLYRTALAPEQNRADVPADWAAAGLAWRERDVGQPLYPLGRAERWRLNVDVPEPQAHRQRSPMQWSPDGRHLAWLDSQGSRLRLIVAEAGSVAGAERILVHELGRPDLLCLGRADPACASVPTEGVSFRWPAQAVEIVVKPPGRAPERVRRIAWQDLRATGR